MRQRFASAVLPRHTRHTQAQAEFPSFLKQAFQRPCFGPSKGHGLTIGKSPIKNHSQVVQRGRRAGRCARLGPHFADFTLVEREFSTIQIKLDDSYGHK
jgi:hypothetical protein